MENLNANFEESKFYHVYARGIAKQIIFEETSDSQHFLNLLKSYSKKYKITIVCYCLMINHVHFICQDTDDNIKFMMNNLCSTYARYFNKKYERTGTLFQRPYKKKIIKNDAYLLSAFRYIITNPEKDGVCSYKTYK